MSVILAFLTAVLLVLFGDRMLRRRATPEERVIVPRYVHPGHGWARRSSDGYVQVGIDEFGQGVIGSVDSIELPRLLRRVRQGEVALRIRHGKRVVPVLSPVSGWVVEKNEMVQHDPTLVNTSPLGDGWLFKVRPVRFSSEVHNLMTGRAASQWLELVRARLAGLFAGTPALLFQDGGFMLENLSDRCSDEEWDRVVSEIFHVEMTEAKQ